MKSLSEINILELKKNRVVKDKLNYVDLITKHPILVINIFAVIGGLINLMYFFKIEYLPILNMNNVLFLFVVSGFVGLVFIILILSYLVFPVISYKSFKDEKLRNITYSDNQKIDIKLKGKLFLIPMFLYIVSSILAVRFYFSDHESNDIGIVIMWVFFNILCPSFLFLHQVLREKINFRIGTFLTYGLMVFFSYFFMLFSFLITVSILQNSEEFSGSNFYQLTFLGLFIFAFLIINIRNDRYLEQAILSIIVLFMLLFMTKTYHIIPYAIMKMFNLGQIQITSMQVNKKSCKILMNKEEDQCNVELPNLYLLWRSGKNFILEKRPDNNETKTEMKKTIYVIPENSIEGWSTEKIIRKNQKESKTK